MKLEDLQAIDLLTQPVVNDIAKGIAEAKGSKIIYRYEQLDVGSPWIFADYAKDRQCKKWHRIYFERFGILPRNCMGCWKIVARPRNLDLLFELLKLQQRLGLPGKCGVDMRPTETYKGIHLGFWYGPLWDLKASKELFVDLRRKVRGAVSLDTPVILKRGCTEMENYFGPSHLWEYTLEMRMKEDLLDTTIELIEQDDPQPRYLQGHITRFWILYSHRMQDPTAKKYIRNYPNSTGSVPTTTYHGELPKIKQEIVNATPGIQGLPSNK